MLNSMFFFTIVIALLALFFFLFEKHHHLSRDISVLVVMTTMGVVGKIGFFFIPGVDPLVAVVIFTGLYFGVFTGLMTGMLSVFIANFLFTQGPWTPFQMLATGLIGVLAGSFYKIYKNKPRASLLILGIVSGVGYSLFMDIWTVLSIDGYFSWQRYVFVLAPAIPFTITYVVSNVFFLELLYQPFDRVILRFQKKYLPKERK